MSAAGTVRIYKLVKGDGAGGHLRPPGHWNHRWSAEEYPTARSRKAVGWSTLDGLLDPDSGAVDVLRERVRKIMDAGDLVCSELWLRSVYTHFQRCYSPDGVNARVENAVTPSELNTQHYLAADLPRDATPEQRAEVRKAARERAAAEIAAMPDEWHLAVMWVRRFFPDHDPRRDLITDPRGTTGPCVRCGRQVQYEPRVDALATVPSSHRNRSAAVWKESALCADGFPHELKEGGA